MAARPSEPIVGKIGRVTGRVRHGEIGEVMLAYQGGTCAFHARPADPNTIIPVGDYALVVDFHPPQMVLVDPVPAFLLPTTR